MVQGSKRERLQGVLAMFAPGAVALAVSAAFSSRLPDPMPIHWDAAGEPDGFAPKIVGLLLLPSVALVVGPVVRWAMRSGKARLAADVAALLTGLFMLGVHRMAIGAALSSSGAMSIASLVALMGGLFAGLGFVMPHLSQNRHAGFRTPWSLASETNWTLTHRFGAWTMGLGGALGGLLALVIPGPGMFWVALAPMVAGSLLPLGYSYVLHRVRS